MIGYGFGYDEELPAGFQDADLEMREWEDRAAEAGDREEKKLKKDVADLSSNANMSCGKDD